MTGRVYLVGAGPGDVGLISVRGRRLLESADAVVYDRLISPRLLDFIPRHAKRVYVGKTAGRHAMRQVEIQQLLVDLAETHPVVVRLKGGDPFVFGRGGEEAMWLRDHGVPFEVVPGVTSAVAVPAYAGIPLTHRGVSDGFTVVTGQTGELRRPDVTTGVDLLRRGGTLVVLMGLAQLAGICDTLRSRGIAADTPAAAIASGTRAGQQVVQATLGSLGAQVQTAGLTSPVVLVFGRVASMQATLSWWAERPLAGRQFVLAVETEHEAETVGAALDDLGAEFVTFVAERQAIVDVTRLDRDVDRLVSGATAVPKLAKPQSDLASDARPPAELRFASALDVALFFRRYFERGYDIRKLAAVQIRAHDDRVRQALQRFGIQPDLVDGDTAGAGAAGVGAARPAAAGVSAAGAAYALGFKGPDHVRAFLDITPGPRTATERAPDSVVATSRLAWQALLAGVGTTLQAMPPCVWLDDAVPRRSLASAGDAEMVERGGVDRPSDLDARVPDAADECQTAVVERVTAP